MDKNDTKIQNFIFFIRERLLAPELWSGVSYIATYRDSSYGKTIVLLACGRKCLKIMNCIHRLLRVLVLNPNNHAAYSS